MISYGGLDLSTNTDLTAWVMVFLLEDENDISDESIQNTQFWSAAIVEDMITNPIGFPIIAYNLSHLDTDGIREFRNDLTIPAMRVTENSGADDDNRQM